MNSATYDKLSPMNKLAVRSAIASQSFLKEASVKLDIPIELLTIDDLAQWLATV